MLGGPFARLPCRYNPFRLANGVKQGSRTLMHSVYHHHMAHSSGTRYGTTILCVRKGDKVVLMGDGQVTQNNMCVKPNARKLRTLAGNKVITGFAGATADAFTLFERLETKLEEYPGQLLRACVELAKMWRTDRYLKNLEALMIVADENISLEVSGNGDVLESHDGVIAVGSGGGYALAAARALYDVDGLTARDIAQKSMQVAADLCIYTNHHFTTLELSSTATTASSTDKTPSPPSLPPTLFEPNLPKPVQ